MANQIKIGDQAPDFTLPDEDMKPTKPEGFSRSKSCIGFLCWSLHYNMY